MKEGYQDDLAFIHDAGFGGLAEGASSCLLQELRKKGVDGGLIVDLGCGSGTLARRVASKGFDVLGIDISESMIALARERLPGGEFRVGTVLDASIPSCIAVTAIGECFNYQFDNRNNDSALKGLFRIVFNALKGSGLFMFDVSEPGRVAGSGPYKTYTEGPDWAVLMTALEDRERSTLTRQITSFRKVGECYRRGYEVHKLRLLNGSEVERRLRGAGFRVRRLRGYGDVRFNRGHTGFLARKP